MKEMMFFARENYVWNSQKPTYYYSIHYSIDYGKVKNECYMFWFILCTYNERGIRITKL